MTRRGRITLGAIVVVALVVMIVWLFGLRP
jgi:hypothetical protein